MIQNTRDDCFNKASGNNWGVFPSRKAKSLANQYEKLQAKWLKGLKLMAKKNQVISTGDIQVTL